MVVRELTAADLGDEVLLDLIRHDDPLGVLSIYVDGESTVTGRGAAIDIKSRLVELERNVADDGSPRRADALSATLRRIGATVERFFDPRADGRGHALFAWLGGAELVSVSGRLRRHASTDNATCGERKAQPAADANTAMTSDQISYDTRSELGAVVGWRRGRLLAAGFVPELAASLAADCRIDLHAVLDLIDRDCPPALAARILAPLDDDPRPC